MSFRHKKPEKGKESEGARQAILGEVLAKRKRIEEVIGEKGGGHWDLIDRSGDLVQSVTPEGRFFYVNRTWLDTLGYPEEEVKGLTFVDILTPECRDHCIEIFKKLQGGSSFEKVDCDFLTRDGRVIPVQGSVGCYFEEGKPVATRGIFKLVTTHEDAEKEFACGEGVMERESEEQRAERFDVEELFLEFHDLTGLRE